MADYFSIDLSIKVEEQRSTWEIIRILTETVEHVTPDGKYFTGTWGELVWQGRRWERDSLKDLEVLAARMDLEGASLYWSYATEGLQWSLTAHMWSTSSHDVELSAFGGHDRLSTEAAVRQVVKLTAERGVHLKQRPTEVTSEEGPRKGAAHSLSINFKPRRKWAMFRAWVGPHIGAYIVGVIASITAAVLLISLGVGG